MASVYLVLKLEGMYRSTAQGLKMRVCVWLGGGGVMWKNGISVLKIAKEGVFYKYSCFRSNPIIYIVSLYICNDNIEIKYV